jgi:hypothetical protein
LSLSKERNLFHDGTFRQSLQVSFDRSTRH